MLYLTGKRGESSKETLGMTSDGLGEMFKGDFTDMCMEKFFWTPIGMAAKIL
jgi:hypothetical protein